MWFFSNASIKLKLRLVIVLVCTLVLLMACVGFGTYEWVSFRQGMVDDLETLGKIVSANSTAALSFMDRQAATEALSALGGKPHLEAACFYASDGTIFAFYRRDGEDRATLPETPGEDGARFQEDRLVLFQPMLERGARIGTLYMRSDLEEVDERLRRYAGIAGFVLGISLLAAFALAGLLQKRISGPILELVHTAETISQKQDYSVRAARLAEDELGVLADAFNQMLQRIGEREETLRGQAHSIAAEVQILVGSVGKISSAASRLATSTSQTASATSQTSSAVDQMRAQSNLSTQTVEAVAEQARQSTETAEEGRRASQEAVAGMQQIRAQMASVAENMVRLGEQSRTIGEIVATVDDLAEQANLLAINAAIQAARAGEQGRAFAVVAAQVKRLAERSRAATRQVRQILGDIHRGIRDAVQATEAGSRSVEEGSMRSETAGGAMEELLKRIGETAEAMTRLAVSSQEQARTVEQVARAMEDIRRASVDNAESTAQLNAETRKLDQMGKRLEALAARN